MIRVSQAGLTMGITIRQKVVISPAPSIFADSSTVSGSIESMNCFIRYSPSEEEKVGMISAQ